MWLSKNMKIFLDQSSKLQKFCGDFLHFMVSLQAGLLLRVINHVARYVLSRLYASIINNS